MLSTMDWPALFADYGATAGGIYEFTDLSTLFKDTAGTDPVNSVGDQIALIKDKSGLGHDFSQTNARNRPLYYVDAKGLNCANFIAANPSYMDGSGLNCDEVTVFYAFLYTSATAGRILDTRGTGKAGTAKGWYSGVGDGSAGTSPFIVDDGVGHYLYNDPWFQAKQNANVAISFYCKGSGTIFSRAVTQGGDKTVAVGPNSILGWPIGDVTSTAQCRMGAPSNMTTNTLTLNGFMYACGSIGAVLSATDRDRVVNYLRDISISV